ncbi:MAG: Asp23/Gls24 family envelope stress response protein [Christensenella sp.]|uniref:Asp23/Gls24 family envelope stress response protein n=1 Tax=Christensenella sp. TaxID=1935934 RepID=UPI002B1ECBF8|nr:Asp23/Gls24 family envelope stress response protein [Christensenella sp.]MEA5004100.1 Asp23/Gls24 family envelope stress response protein [Christensenella sp.]
MLANEMMTTGETTLVRHESYGTVRYANEVLATIAGLAAEDVPGVSAMSGNFIEGMGELLGMKRLNKGISVAVSEQEVTIDAAIVAEYGRSIPVVAQSVRANIIQSLESMTGLKVTAVNVRIQKLDLSTVGNEAIAYA